MALWPIAKGGALMGRLADIERATAVATGRFDGEVLKWLQGGFQALLRSEGAVTLESCLHLPTTTGRMRLARRNAALVDVAALIDDAPTPWVLANEVSRELDRFLQSGPWRFWREQAEPPAEASRLRAALFRLAKSNGGRSLSAKQINRILRDAFPAGNVRGRV